ncbi:hypothetical protein KSZ_29910 [Dictyobacter formicarum]|uniref:Uncharacterized protein n=1 Tax=Dictyobacter formicarum TaxID=2778368 RepID=A0ABQ3VG44_9CHLR|nr:hypothetical protein KSZ_29910 [Dictyobacter formicarum]
MRSLLLSGEDEHAPGMLTTRSLKRGNKRPQRAAPTMVVAFIVTASSARDGRTYQAGSIRRPMML